MHTLKLTTAFDFICQPERYFLSNQTIQYSVSSYVVHLSSDSTSWPGMHLAAVHGLGQHLCCARRDKVPQNQTLQT